MKKLFKKADDLMNELGYVLIEENKFGASYTKTEVSYSQPYVHQIDIIRSKQNGYNVFSYEKGLNSDLFNNAVKLSSLEMAALQKKYRELCRKYGRM